MKQALSKRLLKNGSWMVTRWMPRTRSGDKVVALLRFVAKHQRFPTNRLLFNDTLYRLKTSKEIDNPLRVFVSDKEFVKLYVRSIVGDQYTVPTLRILRSVEEVDAYVFPDDCCIKPTHASGKVILRRNAAPVDIDEIKAWFNLNLYEETRERNYRTLVPKVIIEPLLFGEVDLTDYRFFCFKGEPRLIALDLGKYSTRTRAFYDPDWNEQPFSLKYPKTPHRVERPANLAEMLEVARKLSEGFDFVRVDIYSNGSDCRVGEITNCHASANQSFVPPSAEPIASKLLFG